MTEKDRQLIKEAKSIPHVDWGYIISELIPQAESQEAKSELRSRANYLYHLDEYGVGAL
jgi:hypothetical protein